ncbi:hypothetical protein Dsin_000963 [Dipteronia sinensis]|uniref:RNase H type-1 domain-containing protein n=1 Tax=Dipteronia sinensis TaxID=43782 RepID=A0AAE0B3E6_9ROSI|nr:hypothetical protein Dsin_000963 [Dipteronia sinensis]
MKGISKLILTLLLMWLLEEFVLMAIIRNFEGRVLASSAQVVVAGYSPIIFEALAVFRGPQFAREVGFWPCSFKTDAQVVVNLISSNDIICSEVGLIIRDICLLLKDFPSCNVDFVLRKPNMAAYSLVKIGLSSVSDTFWMEEWLPSVAFRGLGRLP